MGQSPTHKDAQAGIMHADEDYGETMTFPEAMQAVIEGKLVARAAWGDDEVYVCINGDRLRILDKKDNLLHPLIVSEVDMRSNDWIEIE